MNPRRLLLIVSLQPGCADDGSISVSGLVNTTSYPDSATSEAMSSSGSEDPTEGVPSPEVPDCNPADDLEPNNTESQAHVLNNVTDQDTDGSLVASILAGDQDVDWFAYMGSDVAFAYVDPTGFIDADDDVRLCLYVECMIGYTPPPDCINSVYDESPEEGLVGCCDVGGDAFVSIDLTCVAGEGDDSAWVFMKVDRGTPDVCVHYDLEYHF